jgi:hypothetical protein
MEQTDPPAKVASNEGFGPIRAVCRLCGTTWFANGRIDKGELFVYCEGKMENPRRDEIHTAQ